MSKPTLLDGIELLVDLPENDLRAGTIGTIVEEFGDAYEVEFTNSNGETLALCTLEPDQFIVVWSAETKSWLSTPERVATLVSRLPDDQGQQVLEFARSLTSDFRLPNTLPLPSGTPTRKSLPTSKREVQLAPSPKLF